ncbi:hypothetical protein CCM_02053 [Cordyceps militaris CM01]|uniref:Uncharacterized protein n=1 Tax=Cordyceps militaris (strain CM01) TaxID=983644 RepID=G3JCB9_CORMM|nr:uncharacterized protein CCM_02053 [Cordyceps militaris CM01]EGX93784.1 hypothetical protein CCM_02053 [Cordyceps militaris CM01]
MRSPAATLLAWLYHGLISRIVHYIDSSINCALETVKRVKPSSPLHTSPCITPTNSFKSSRMKVIIGLVALLELAGAIPLVAEPDTALKSDIALQSDTTLESQAAQGLPSGLCIYSFCKPLKWMGISEKSYTNCKATCKIPGKMLKASCPPLCQELVGKIPLVGGATAAICTRMCEALFDDKDPPPQSCYFGRCMEFSIGV